MSLVNKIMSLRKRSPDKNQQGSTKPSAPGSTNLFTDITYKLVIVGSKNLSVEEVILAFQNIQDDFVGDLYCFELINALTVKAVKRLFDGKRYNPVSTGGGNQLRWEFDENFPGTVISHGWVTPSKKGGFYSKDHRWITPTCGRIDVFTQVKYMLTRTPGIDLNTLPKLIRLN